MLRCDITGRHEDHEAEVGTGVVGGERLTEMAGRCGGGELVIVARDAFGGRQHLIDGDGGRDAHHRQRFGKPSGMIVGQEDSASKRPKLLRDGGPEHEACITDRQGQFGTRKKSSVEPCLLAPDRLGRGHRFDRSGG